jgi:DNA-binding transcriptional LysR family regulator
MHPDVTLEVEYRRSTHVYTEVLEGNVDFGLVAFPKKRKGIAIDATWQDELVIICPPAHNLASEDSVSLERLKGENFISFEPDLPTRKAIDTFLRENSVSVHQSMEFDNIETVKRAVEIEHGISIVPRATVKEEVEGGSLAAVDIDAEGMVRTLGAIRKRTHPKTPAYREFLALLTREEFGVNRKPRKTEKSAAEKVPADS